MRSRTAVLVVAVTAVIAVVAGKNSPEHGRGGFQLEDLVLQSRVFFVHVRHSVSYLLLQLNKSGRVNSGRRTRSSAPTALKGQSSLRERNLPSVFLILVSIFGLIWYTVLVSIHRQSMLSSGRLVQGCVVYCTTCIACVVVFGRVGCSHTGVPRVGPMLDKGGWMLNLSGRDGC